VTTSQQQRDEWLDLVRGLCALLVCAGHLRSALFMDRGGNGIGLLADGFYAITSLGHEAVMVFFVLSGYWVGGSVLKQAAHFSWTRYALARGSRLWVVLVPALVITLLIDLRLDLVDPSLLQGAYYADLSSGPAATHPYSRSLLTWLGNLFMLQNLLVPVFGSNGPLWSLACEAWYYLIFPLGVIGLRPGGSAWIRWLCLGLGAAALLVISPGFLPGLMIWLMGVAAAALSQRQALPESRGWQVLAVLAVAASLAQAKLLAPTGRGLPWSDGWIGLSVACWILSLRGRSELPQCLPLRAMAHWLSSISYSLYLFHFPLVLLIFAELYRHKALEFNFNHLLQFVFWLAAILTLSHLAWWAFERRTAEVRAVLSRKLQGLSSAQP
jgi:peptidoglycan/LPS O-acetylase OafA/YrhL